MSPTIETISKKIIPILRRHNVKRAGIFGSAARGKLTAKSDIDVLVEIADNISLLDFAGIKCELEEMLGRSVDLVEYGALKPAIRENILSEQVSII